MTATRKASFQESEEESISLREVQGHQGQGNAQAVRQGGDPVQLKTVVSGVYDLI